MSDDSPLNSGADSPSSSYGMDGRARKSPDSLTGFESHPYVNFSAAHQHVMAQAALAGLAGPSGVGKKAALNNNMVKSVIFIFIPLTN